LLRGGGVRIAYEQKAFNNHDLVLTGSSEQFCSLF
jgi:hypothetical protein